MVCRPAAPVHLLIDLNLITVTSKNFKYFFLLRFLTLARSFIKKFLGLQQLWAMPCLLISTCVLDPLGLN